MKYITLEQLLAEKACKEQVDIFKQQFPSGKALVTVKRARALSSVFDWNWAALNLLTPAAREAYMAVERPAWKDYKAVKRQAWEAYEAVERPAWEAYEAVRRSAWEAYKAVERPALEAYEAVRRPAWEAFEAQRAEAFARAYLSMEEEK